MVDTWGKNQGREKMRIRAGECAGLVIDIQERLFPVMYGGEELLNKIHLLLEGLEILDIPILVTEQYPAGLGATIDSLSTRLKEHRVIEKISFSCCGESRFIGALKELGKNTLIICGIEAHVCVLQTAIDLIEKGITPVVVADCISSRTPEDKNVALERLRFEGAVITTSESILFELTRQAGTPQFKSISRLIK